MSDIETKKPLSLSLSLLTGKSRRARGAAFTIVELLIVIVVIAVLAAITIVAYNGVQQRAADSRRFSDMAAIQKALELFKIDNGNYPSPTYSGAGPQEGWEVSSREANGEFIAPLKNYGFSNGVVVDPINNATEKTMSESKSVGKFAYYYYRYGPGTAGCSSTRGDFYILGILKTGQYGYATYPSSPGIDGCIGPWPNYFSWFIGKYQN